MERFVYFAENTTLHGMYVFNFINEIDVKMLSTIPSPTSYRMAVLCFVGTQPLPRRLLGLYTLRQPHALCLDPQHGCHDLLGLHRIFQLANSCWKFG